MMSKPLTLILSLLLLFVSPVHADNTELKEKIYEARDELIQTGQKNRELKVKLDQQEDMITELREELEKLEQEIEKEGES